MKITKTKSGKWTTHIAITGADGKRHYKTFTHKNKSIVAQMAADYKVDHALYIESSRSSALPRSTDIKRIFAFLKKIMLPSAINRSIASLPVICRSSLMT